MRSLSIPIRALAGIALIMISRPAPLTAQAGHHHDPNAMPHARFTEPRAGSAADTARALALVSRVREAIAPYSDPEKARAAGYRLGALAEMKGGGRLVHMGNPQLRRGDAEFDLAKPQALLYRRDRDGELRLAGAMFTAPGNSSDEELDARIPLSIARWHRHVNVCLPPPGRARDRSLRGSRTADACARAGGRFVSESPRYMVHVMTDAGDDLAASFPQGRRKHMDP